MANRRRIREAFALALVAIASTSGLAQLFKYNQTSASTARFDAQRSGWTRTDYYIAPDKMSEFSFQWKTKIAARPVGNAALSGGVVAGAGLGITLGFVGTSDNRTIAIDMDTGYVFYNHVYDPIPHMQNNSCLSASLATPSKSTTLTPAPAPPPTPAGGAVVGPNTPLPFGSVLGEPNEGVPPVKPGSYYSAKGSYFGLPNAKPYDGTPASAKENAAFVASGGVINDFPRQAANADGGGAPGPGLNAASPRSAGAAAPARINFGPRAGGPTYSVSADGMMHTLSNRAGLDEQQPVPFLPSGAQATALILVNGTLYTSTQKGCGNTPNGVWAISTTPVVKGGSFPKPIIWNTGGTASANPIAMSPNGSIYVATTSGTGDADSVVELDAKTLTKKAIFTLRGANFSESPIIFRDGDRDILVAQAADGRIILLDTAALSRPLYISPTSTQQRKHPLQAMASWQDASGQRWLIATTADSLEAWKVSIVGGSATLTSGWSIHSLKTPLAPLVINGTVFVLSSGDGSTKTNAELFAADGVTGEVLWRSGKSIGTYVPETSALWSSMGQVLVGGADDTIYAFGMTMDRHL